MDCVFQYSNLLWGHEKMMDYLECDGLDIDLIKIDDLEWWADEVWKLKSTWSPEGVVVYLTFLVDPQHEGNRKKGEAVWGIGCSKTSPLSREHAESGCIVSYGKLFKKDVNDFLLKMENLRISE